MRLQTCSARHSLAVLGQQPRYVLEAAKLNDRRGGIGGSGHLLQSLGGFVDAATCHARCRAFEAVRETAQFFRPALCDTNSDLLELRFELPQEVSPQTVRERTVPHASPHQVL